jgi:hypothetical protein
MPALVQVSELPLPIRLAVVVAAPGLAILEVAVDFIGDLIRLGHLIEAPKRRAHIEFAFFIAFSI